MDEKKNEIILFENQGVKLEVNLKDETVWLNLEQMAELFDRDKSVISRHIKNALTEELKDEVVIAKFTTTTKHGASAKSINIAIVCRTPREVIHIFYSYFFLRKTFIIIDPYTNKTELYFD